MEGQIKITFSHCGKVVIDNEDEQFESVPTLHDDKDEQYECAPTRHELKAQFGAMDVEALAVAIYDCFHGLYCNDPDSIEPWPLFGEEKNDIVVEAFRKAAVEVAAKFADGHIGGVYYGK